MKKYILHILCLFSSIGLLAQPAQQTWELGTSETGNKTYIAKELIIMKPGFSYKPTSNTSLHAKINPALLFPPTNNTYATENGTITTDPAAGAVVGNLSGEFDVNAAGAATYNFPISCPAGINGMSPEISLVYNGQLGAGVAGWGWNIGGLSIISRTTKSYYFDNDKSGIIWDKTTPLTLDGQRLIKVQEWTDSIQYSSENDATDRIVAYNIKAWGPLNFKIYQKNGNVLEYGNPANVASYYPIKTTQGGNVSPANYSQFHNQGWALYRITDSNNNFIEFTYRGDPEKNPNEASYFHKNNNIENVSYGNNAGGNKQVVGNIKFTYKRATYYHTVKYIDGMQLFCEKILSHIEVQDGQSKLIEAYDLEYRPQEANDYLKSIKKKNADGESIHPLRFEWSQPVYTAQDTLTREYGKTPNIKSFGDVSTFHTVSFGDIDGDGRADALVQVVMKNDKKYWVVYRNTGGIIYPYAAEYEWNPDEEKTFFFMDLDNDGKDELYVGKARYSGINPYYVLDCYKYENGKMTIDNTGYQRVQISESELNNNKKQLYAVAGDFLGNGESQLLIVANKNRIVASNLPAFNLSTFGNQNKSRIYLSDINGNGKTEIMYIVNGQTTFYEFEKKSDTQGEFKAILTTDQFKFNDYIFNGDFNGDGNTDFLVRNYSQNTTGWRQYQSTGKTLLSIDMKSFITNDADVNKVQILDVNRDGNSDILVEEYNWINSAASTTTLKLLLGVNGTFETKILNYNHKIIPGAYKASANFTDNNNSDVFINYNARHPRIISLSKDIQFNKLTGITNSYGEYLAISYQAYKSPYTSKQLAGNSDTESYSFYENLVQTSPPQLEVVKSTQGSGINTVYTYANPYVHKGKGFLGFLKLDKRDNIRGTISSSERVVNGTFGIAYPYKETSKLTSGSLISEDINNFTLLDQGSKKYFLRLDSQVSSDKLNGTTVTKTFSDYDTSRNPQILTVNRGNGFVETKTIEYIKAGSLQFNKTKSVTTTKTSSGETAYTRKEEFQYDAKGNLLKKISDSGNQNAVTINYSNYDRYGNARTVSTVANSATRTTTYEYSSSGRFITKETDHTGKQTNYVYNESKGLLESLSDRRGQTTHRYDGWGRLISTQTPDNIETVSLLKWATSGSPAGAKYYDYSETSCSPTTITWYDSRGRKIRVDSYGLNDRKILVDTEYNEKGQVYRVSEPYFENGARTWAQTSTYDNYGRTITSQTPMGTTRYVYTPLAVEIISPDAVTKETMNSAGQVVTKTTNGKTVAYKYYASGLLKSATPEGGSAITMQYDLQGNQTSLNDPSLGVITSTYNAWGQELSEKQKIHGEGEVITTYTYYPSGLIKNILRNGENTQYTYDGYNRVTNITIPGKHTQILTYDPLDRVTKISETIASERSYVSETMYDDLGRPYIEIAPSGFTTRNIYDKNGYLVEVKSGDNTSIWRAIESNARGQLLKTAQGNKITTHTFDSRGLPTKSLADGVINMNYSFNAKGNLEYRQDELTNQKESFTYDTMNRLTGWSITSGSNNTMSYDPTTGTIRNKSDLGYTMNYGENGAPPHAISSIAGKPDIMSGETQSITYTDFKKMSTITEGADNLKLYYGIDDERRKAVFTKGNTVTTRYYFGKYEEEIVGGQTRKTHYINGGNGLAAIYIIDQNSSELYYAYTDFQGSLIALTSSNGAIKEKYAYDPWGSRRNPAKWSDKDTRTAWVSTRGYTMHEHLDDYSLINMGGRAYDPLTAMFLSPDPFLQAPDNWLNFNRYGYCYNNPFRYVDPNGEIILPVLIAVGIGFVTGYTMHGITTGNWGFKAVTSGLISGVAAGIGFYTGIPIDADKIVSATPLKALKYGLNFAINQGLSNIMPSIDMPFGNFGVSVSPFVMFSAGACPGTPFSYGASVTASYSSKDFSLAIGFNENQKGVNNTYGGGAIHNGKQTYSYYHTWYKQGDKQRTGTIGFNNGNSFSFRLENDFLSRDGDRFRSNAVELGFKDYLIGTSVYTTQPGVDEDKPLAIENGSKFNDNKYGTYEHGWTESSPFYIGKKNKNRSVTRIGYNHPIIGDIVQNGFHRWFPGVNSPNFKRGTFSSPFIQTGSYLPYSLY